MNNHNLMYTSISPDDIVEILRNVSNKTTQVHKHLSESTRDLDSLTRQLNTLKNMREHTSNPSMIDYISRVEKSLHSMISVISDTSRLMDQVKDNISEMVDVEKDMLSDGHIVMHNKLNGGNIHHRCDGLRYKECNSEDIRRENIRREIMKYNLYV